MKTVFLLCSFTLVLGSDLSKVRGTKDGHRFGPNLRVPKDLQNLGTINVEGHGTVKVLSPADTASNIQILDNGFTVNNYGRVYLATGDDFNDPFVYWNADLRNKHWTYSLDVSNVGCKCNAAMYWVKMPGYQDQNGEQVPSPGPGGDFYCDANYINNNWCPEYDMYEGNSETVAVTLHHCTSEAPNSYDQCDRGGCQTNACDGIPKKYCKGCDIDTSKLHTISHTQIFKDDKMVASNHYFQQEANNATFDACSDPDYVDNMSEVMDGMVPVFTLWDMGSSETWLDGCTGCEGSCDLSGSSVTWKDFKFQSAQLSPSKYVRELYAKYN